MRVQPVDESPGGCAGVEHRDAAEFSDSLGIRRLKYAGENRDSVDESQDILGVRHPAHRAQNRPRMVGASGIQDMAFRSAAQDAADIHLLKLGDDGWVIIHHDHFVAGITEFLEHPAACGAESEHENMASGAELA